MNEGTSWTLEEKRVPLTPGSVVMGGWEIRKLIGKGTYGEVYEAFKSEAGLRVGCAIKVIPIPHDTEELTQMHNLGLSEESIAAELAQRRDRAIREIAMMIKLRNHPHAVNCSDFSVVQYEEDGSWDILIRMDLLTSLGEWAKRREVTEEDVRRLGLELSELLTELERQQMMHRDIKPGNIFVNDAGSFQLGDFGLARIMTVDSTYSRGTGTELFMAPEVFRNEKYDHRADIYGLGLVMYWLLNQRRFPFHEENLSLTSANSLRLSNKPLPPLNLADQALEAAVLKACMPLPEQRYGSALAFHEALQKKTAEQQLTPSPARQAEPVNAAQPARRPGLLPMTEQKEPENVAGPKQRTVTEKPRKRFPVLLLLLLLFLGAGVFAASKTIAVPYRCTGAAMEETLHDGDLTLVKVLNYEPARGDVVVCKNGQTVMFRRVIGLAGDTVAIDPVEGVVSVNGNALTEDYVKSLAVGNLSGDTSITLEDGYVYLLGDNRVEAEDSRILGPVLVSKLEGKVWFVLSPGLRRIR